MKKETFKEFINKEKITEGSSLYKKFYNKHKKIYDKLETS